MIDGVDGGDSVTAGMVGLMEETGQKVNCAASQGVIVVNGEGICREFRI